MQLIVLKKGAVDYLVKPYNFDELKLIIENAVNTRELKRKVWQLENEIKSYQSDIEFIGISEKIKEVLEKIKNVYDKDVSILILGASGTGKNLLAQLIHKKSKRRDKPFISINCAAIPETLIENEFFGHIKGAYTGAYTFQYGKLEAVTDGDLFLDEIGALSLNSQAKLLKVIEEKKFMRIGDTKEIQFSGRIIAATSLNLEQAIKERRFREDLYYRLSVFPIELPQLKEHKEDIRLLVDYFIKTFNKKYNLDISGADEKLIKLFEDYDWPGNVRELQNVIERLCLLAAGNILTLTELTDGYAKLLNKDLMTNKKSKIKTLEEVEEEYIKKILEMTNNNISQTAKILGISRKTLYNKILKKA